MTGRALEGKGVGLTGGSLRLQHCPPTSDPPVRLDSQSGLPLPPSAPFLTLGRYVVGGK